MRKDRFLVVVSNRFQFRIQSAPKSLSLEITSDRFTSNRFIGFRGNFGKTLPRSIQTLWTHLFKYSETIFESVLTRPSFKNTQMYNKYRNLTTLVLMRRQEREADWKRNFSDRLLFALWRREKKKKKKKKKQSSRRAALSKSFRLRLEFVQRPERFAFHRGQYISRGSGLVGGEQKSPLNRFPGGTRLSLAGAPSPWLATVFLLPVLRFPLGC